MTVFQDVAQIKDRYGTTAGTVVNNHRAKLFLPGISDLDTLDLPAGSSASTRPTATDHHRHHGPPIEHRLALAAAPAPELVRQLNDGEGVLLYGNLPSIRVRLRPWYRNRALRRRANHPQDALAGPGPDTGAPAPPLNRPRGPPPPTRPAHPR